MTPSLHRFLQDTYTQNKTNRFLTARDFLELEPFLVEQHFSKEGILYREGDKSSSMLFVTRGKVQASKKVQFKREVVLGLYHPGAILGEMCLLCQSPRAMTVKALEETAVLMLTHEKFEELNHARPELANRLLQLMMHTSGRRLRLAYNRLASVF